MWNLMTVFWHVLSKKLSSCASKLLNNEEKRQKQSANPPRHLVSAWEQTDVAIVVSVTLRVHNMKPLQAAKQHVQSV